MTSSKPWWQDENRLTKRATGYLFHDLSSLRHFLHKAKAFDDWAAAAVWEKTIELKKKNVQTDMDMLAALP